MTKHVHVICRHIASLLLAVTAISGAAESSRLRVATSGDYPPFSVAAPGTPSGYRGFEIALVERFAAERGIEIEWLRFRWPQLLEDLAAGRFDVAASGITLRPERSVAGRFSVATAESGAVALVADPAAHPTLESLDSPRVRIGVNAGGHLERVADQRFPRATRIAIPDNRGVLAALAAGQLDAVVSDTHEATLWRRELPGSASLGPFTRDRKAWLLGAAQAALAAELDDWLLAREADGSLAELRDSELGEAGPPSAEPLRALCAALDERLSLMRWVAVAKRRGGLPLEVPEREARVVAAALAAVSEAALRAGRPDPPQDAVEDFFRAQFEAAKQLQRSALSDSELPSGERVPDLQEQLRPALLRIGERVARLIVALPSEGVDAQRVEEVVRAELRVPQLSPASRQRLTRALLALAKATAAQRTSTRASSPASTGNTRQTA